MEVGRSERVVCWEVCRLDRGGAALADTGA